MIGYYEGLYDDLRAAVEALMAENQRVLPSDHEYTGIGNADLRALLTTPAPEAAREAMVTPGGNPTCAICGNWYGIGIAHQCPAPDLPTTVQLDDAIARVRKLLDPHRSVDTISGQTSEVHPVHIRARDLRAALGDGQ